MNYYCVPGLKGKMMLTRLETSKERIFDCISKEYQVTKQELIDKCRKSRVVEPRQILCYVLRQHTRLTYDEIGTELNRDHTTIIHAVTTVKNRMETEDEYRDRVRFLLEQIFD